MTIEQNGSFFFQKPHFIYPFSSRFLLKSEDFVLLRKNTAYRLRNFAAKKDRRLRK